MSTSTDPAGEGIARPLVFLHVGDLHLTHLGHAPEPALAARQKRLRQDLADVVSDINAIADRDAIDFVYLPGDLAENGRREEYDAILDALDRLKIEQIRLVPGDHDRGLGHLRDFHCFRDRLVRAGRMPPPKGETAVHEPLSGCPPDQPTGCRFQYHFAEDRDGRLCIFLDLVSAGRGRKGWGLDFRLGSGQADWLRTQLRDRSGRRTAVFMHAYPADLHESDEAKEIAGLLWNEGVQLVEMGHTHYNELGHDGRTLYGSVRSLGQNEDGPAGYAVVAMDDRTVSWRFRQVQQTWPFVQITSPADRRVATGPMMLNNEGELDVRALVLGDRAVSGCQCRIDLGTWHDMVHDPASGLHTASVPWPEGSRTIQVQASDARFPGFGKDYIDFDTIEPATRHAADFQRKAFPERPGSDAFAVGSWPEKGVRGDQLGPNKLGRKW